MEQNSVTIDSDRLVTVAEFAKTFGLSRYLADLMVHNGELPTVRCGKLRRISLRHAKPWLDTAYEVHMRQRRGKRVKKTAAA